METVKTHPAQSSEVEVKSMNILGKFFKSQVVFFEKNRFGMMAMYIIVQSCIGSIACMYVMQNDTGFMLLGICVAVTMAANSFFIAQTSAKSCIVMTYVSIFINVLLILLV